MSIYLITVCNELLRAQFSHKLFEFNSVSIHPYHVKSTVQFFIILRSYDRKIKTFSFVAAYFAYPVCTKRMLNDASKCPYVTNDIH